MEKKKQNLSAVKAIKRIIPLVIKTVPFHAFVTLILSTAHGVSWGLVAPFNQRLYDALADLAIANGVMRYVIIGAVMVTGLMLIQQVIMSFDSFFSYNVLSEVADGRLCLVINEKMKKLPAALFEDKDKLDDLEKAWQGMNGSIWFYLMFGSGLPFYFAYLIVMGSFLWSLTPLLLISIMLIFVPVLASQIVQAKIHAKLEEQIAPVRRKNSHYTDCIINKDFLRETRLFGAYKFFIKLYMDSMRLIIKHQWDTGKKIAFIDLGLNFLKAIGWFSVLGLLFYSLVQGTITIGAFAAVFSAIGMLFGMIEQLVSRINYSLTQNLGQIHNFINVLDFPEVKGENMSPDMKKGVIAKDVVFSYPKADKPAVNGVSIHIKYGETLALVGENGSGKTTLVKLLCGLYHPEEGNVFVGGRDTKTTSEEAIFSQTSGVFQNHASYIFSLGENVKISEVEAENDLITPLKNADVDFDDTKTFPQGVETILSRDFDGVELSGGQWQRVATARGLYRSHEFIVLDEPTAAIDPLEETRVYKKFAELTKDKIAILVTHRLGSARIADKIAVMDDGKIVEIGTHDDLIKNKGKYAEMWTSQADSYK